MIVKDIPKVDYAIIGGSGTWAGDFPENTGIQGVNVLQKDMEFETPFGTTMPMKLFELDAALTADGKPRQVLTVPFHGFHGLSPYNTPSEQVFWVFKRAGVKFIIAEGSGGSINPLLDPGDVIIPHDIIDMTKRPSNVHHFTSNIVRMRDPLCSDLRSLLCKFAKEEYPRVFTRGVYANTEPPRFETASEIRMLRTAGADITGHTIVPESYLARAIGACYASAYIVSNFAEGVEDASWKGSSIFDYYSDCAKKFGTITIKAIAAINPADKKCTCMENIIEVPSTVKKRIAIED
ncbi:MAG: MTAP family purine nucleoside phosphorylase [Eubacteriales bacterium]|jgi:5'-methylthioadenosine phosphorylase